MMSLSINHTKALGILKKSFKSRLKPSKKLQDAIHKVVFGSHKTYRYILFTNLLAKATNSQANLLAIQAGAPISGAYDARSLCHKVLVPFEKDYLAGAIGNSPEPYLNKPARFTHLSTENAVRAGHDREILLTLIKIANILNPKDSATAETCLSYALSLLEEIIANNELLSTVHTIITPDLIDIYRFISRFLEESINGETCQSVVGAIEKQFYLCLKGEYRVVVHKVNQCDSTSSNRVGDIDVFEDKRYFYSIEVKDKTFTVYDVEHAFTKMIEAHGTRGAFVYGPRATFNKDEILIKLYSFEEKRFVTLFTAILPYVRLVLFQTPNANKSNFIQLLLDTAKEMVAKDETIERIHTIAKEMFGKAD